MSIRRDFRGLAVTINNTVVNLVKIVTNIISIAMMYHIKVFNFFLSSGFRSNQYNFLLYYITIAYILYTVSFHVTATYNITEY